MKPTTLEIGARAPEFELMATDGRTVKLSDYKGRKLVLYFYPKDDTPGCTTEACSFRDDMRKFAKAGYSIIGISPDDAKSHAKFAKKYSLNFTLLCDAWHKVAEKYGAWGGKQFAGKKYMGILRTTFLIDENSLITNVFESVRPEG